MGQEGSHRDTGTIPCCTVTIPGRGQDGLRSYNFLQEVGTKLNLERFLGELDYYLTMKRNEVLIYTTTWINLENTMLSERSQMQKAACGILLI